MVIQKKRKRSKLKKKNECNAMNRSGFGRLSHKDLSKTNN